MLSGSISVTCTPLLSRLPKVIFDTLLLCWKWTFEVEPKQSRNRLVYCRIASECSSYCVELRIIWGLGKASLSGPANSIGELAGGRESSSLRSFCSMFLAYDNMVKSLHEHQVMFNHPILAELTCCWIGGQFCSEASCLGVFKTISNRPRPSGDV